MTDLPKRLLITGAASGIGAAVARRLAAPGVSLVLHTRKNADMLAAVSDQVRDRGAAVETVLGDLSDPELPRRLVERAVTEFDGLDAVVANAGWAKQVPLLDSTLEQLDEPAQAIARSFALIAQAAVPAIRAGSARDSGGRIVAVSAFGPHVFRPGVMAFPATSAAKAALETHVRALAFELAGEGITVNAVVPGFIQKDPGTHRAVAADVATKVTDQIPMGRLGTPDEVAAAIGFLLSAEASYVTGQLIHVNGGLV